LCRCAHYKILEKRLALFLCLKLRNFQHYYRNKQVTLAFRRGHLLICNNGYPKTSSTDKFVRAFFVRISNENKGKNITDLIIVREGGRKLKKMKKYLMVLAAVTCFNFVANADGGLQRNPNPTTRSEAEASGRLRQDNSSRPAYNRDSGSSSSSSSSNSSSSSSSSNTSRPAPSQQSEQRPAQGNLQGNPVR